MRYPCDRRKCNEHVETLKGTFSFEYGNEEQFFTHWKTVRYSEGFPATQSSSDPFLETAPRTCVPHLKPVRTYLAQSVMAESGTVLRSAQE